MRNLHRVLLERKTRRFVDQMIHKYTDIRLSATTRAMSRKRPRAEATGVRMPPVNRDHDHGDQAERSTSSYCQTESDRSSRLSSTMLDSERSQFGKGHECQQQLQEESQLDRWRMSEAPTVSECSTFSSARLTRLLEEEDDGYDIQENQEVTSRSSDSNAAVSTQHETEDDQDNSSSTECDTSSPNLESAPVSTQPSVENQSDDQSEQSQCSTESPPTSSSETLPRLRPMTPAHCVVPNCCDYFTSPHPHYPKEVIGKAQKVDESPHVDSSQSNSSSSDTTSEAERGDQSVDHSNDHSNDSTRSGQDGDEFEMWDYVCPQYARRGYANEWV